MTISTSTNITDTDTAGESSLGADTDLTVDIGTSATFLIVDADTANTEKCADMLIFPIPILVLTHP